MSEQKFLVRIDAMCQSDDDEVGVVFGVSAVFPRSKLADFGLLEGVAEAILRVLEDFPAGNIRPMTDEEIEEYREDLEDKS